MIPKLRQKLAFLLRLLVVLQVVGLLGHAAAWASPKPDATRNPVATLSQILGADVAICHHGDGRAPDPGSPGDCCAGGFCHCLSHVFHAPAPSSLSLVPVAARGARVAPHRVVLWRKSLVLGATSARGPPSAV